jgi:Tfp pilus assembly protein PilN
MRAVNLIPAEQRSGGGAGGAGRSGGAVYVILGGLAVLVVLVGVWAMAGHKLSADKAELAQLQADAAAAQSQASKLSSFGTFHALRQTRTDTVRQLAAGRIDWAESLDAIARMLPSGAWLSTMTAATSPSAGPAGGTGGAGAIASTSTGPSIQIGGCIGSQARVARLMPRLHAIPHVARVSLVSSTAAQTTGAVGAATGDCKAVSFEMVLFFEGGTAAAPTPVVAAETQEQPAQ